MLLNWPTSEYQLEYQNLSVAIRKQIWEENIKFREFLAENNRLQHFWYYQSIDGVHKNKDLGGAISAEQIVAVRPQDAETTDDSTEMCATPIEEKLVRSKSVDVLSVLDEPTKLKSALKSKVSESCKKFHSTETTVEKKDVGIQTPRWETQTKKSQTIESRRLYREPCFSTNFTTCRSTSKRTSNHSAPIKSIIVQDKKSPPFLSYGWNDCKKDVGSKRTFNIHASVDEIYPAALHALSRRRAMLKKAEALRQSRPSTAPLLSPVNHSSLWMTEYQDIFSRKRPQSAPFETKSVRWQ